MEKDILNEVIDAEMEIQHCLEAERARLREWIEQVKREAAAAVEQEERNDGDQLAGALEAARREADRQAKGIVAAAARRSERLGHLDDGALSGVIMHQLPRILLE